MYFNLKDFKFKNKKVLLRVDFNLPIKNKKILDDIRIRLALPTINHILKQKPKQLILMTHIGRPKGKDKKLSTRPILKTVSKILKKTVYYKPNINVINKKSKLFNKKIILLENLRFWGGEEKNNSKFAKKLAELGEIYVNDAFANCHRDHASMTSITKFLLSGSGFLVEKELKYIEKIMKKPKKPFIAIIGGIKVKTKLPAIKNLAKNADKVLVGSVFKINAKNKKIILPLDYNRGYDIGPKTIELYKKYIKSAKTILWNGPLGWYENNKYQKGTREIAKAISKSRALSIIGGGDTSAALKRYKLTNKITHISSGGGASLKLFEGKKLIAITALEKSYKKFKKYK